MTLRDSFISTSSSNTYPSTMSTSSSSALGLTDSPLRPRLRSMISSAPSSPRSDVKVRSKPSSQQLRQSSSKNSLYQEATVNAARKVTQHNSRDQVQTIHTKPSKTNLGGSEAGSRPSSRAGTNASLSRPTTVPARAISSNPMTPTKTTSSSRVTQQDQPPRAQITQPSHEFAPHRPPSSRRVPVPKQLVSPARTEVTLAEEWEAEMVRDTRQLDIRAFDTPAGGKGISAEEKQEQRQKDMEWERAGIWETGRDPAREAEDRVRRDIGRYVAFPPTLPRVPVRAAPTGVTSVHIGVRPRLHPLRASDSMLRNQPDDTLPIPLFSPSSDNADLSEESHWGNHNTRYDPALAEKARKEYEDWKAKKAEREGGIADSDTFGTRDWIPRAREVARPGAVEGIAHSEEYENHHHTIPRLPHPTLSQPNRARQTRTSENQPLKVKDVSEAKKNGQVLETQSQHHGQERMPEYMSQAQCWGYPDPYGMAYHDNGTGTGQVHGIEGYYPEQGYWDPSYWWGMGLIADDPRVVPDYHGRAAQHVDAIPTLPNQSNAEDSTPLIPVERYDEP
ncbi:uncharacterized protein IL334_007807 [Kwoniella shivajii]|uniref:Uncharacterized protein n=1 Tax=Kwoniella shivajii TaxID=564305 RepID=A0ABZ1D9P7_9TREE|nr:hypothetical protein IL334_007807 [Kwoniella shivajii]